MKKVYRDGQHGRRKGEMGAVQRKFEKRGHIVKVMGDAKQCQSKSEIAGKVLKEMKEINGHTF